MTIREKTLSERMYILNANISALIHIQKIKSKEEGERFLQLINQHIGLWIKEVRELEEKRGKD